MLCRVIFFTLRHLMFFAVCGSHSVSNSWKSCYSGGGIMGGDLRVLELGCWVTGWWGQGSPGCPEIVTWPLLGEASLKPSASPLVPGLSDCMDVRVGL